MDRDASDTDLVACAQRGHLDSFQVLVERHSPMVFGVSLRMMGNHFDAQDLAQESLLAAWQQLCRFRGESAFATWLYRIVTRRALNRLTRGRADTSLEVCGDLATVAPGPAASAERRDTVNAVDAAVMTLPAAQRVVVVLHHFEGLSYEQIASITDTSVASVRSHLYRARRTLSDMLAEYSALTA